ncbi:MAG TPA: glycoside hydrolase family 28 protein [Verrucomicrobiota bacterium]|nr:glycoside hydrolase family 28 protein [Verrucomicrobiota bacterium]
MRTLTTLKSKLSYALTPVVGAGLLCITTLPVKAESRSDWDSVPPILARIKAPEFPARDFRVTDYGARADGGTDCTDAIRDAIAACHQAGGGRVVVSGGTFLTGPVHLKSGVNLHVAADATLKFIPDFKKYLPVVLTRFEGVECMNYSPLIYAHGQENIAVTGGGTLDGSASWENWWQFVRRDGWVTNLPPSGQLLLDHGERGTPVAERIFGDGHRLRPNFIQPYRCRNILIEGVTITNAPMWVINPGRSTNVTVRGVTVTSHGPNNDGCNPDSSRDVLIEGCLFDTGDDCIAIKSGKNADGRRVNVPSENIIIRNCTMRDGHGGVVLGSETSGGVRNVFAEDCVMDSPNLDRALRLKTNAERGGPIENIFFRNVKVGRVAHSVLTIDLVYWRVQHGPFQPTVRNIEMRNVTSTSSPRALWVVGNANSIIENVRIIDSEFKGVEGPDVLTHSGSIQLENVTVVPAKTR